MDATAQTKDVTVPIRYALVNGYKHSEDPIYLISKTLNRFDTETYHLRLFGMKRMLTQDPKVIQHILQKNNKNYEKSKLQTKNLSKYAGKGLLTTNGEYWLKQRRLIQPGFHKQKLQLLVEEMNRVVLSCVDKVVQKIKETDGKIDVLDEMTSITLRVVSTALFSANITDEEIKILGDGVQELQNATLLEVQKPGIEWWRKLTGAEKRCFEYLQKIYDLITGYIEQRRLDPNPPDDLLTMLLDAKYEGTDEGMNNTQVLDEIMIIFLAGFETTTNALTFAFYLLHHNPEVIQKLESEIEQVTIDENISFQDVMKLDYCRQVIAESMRLYPPAWFMDRVALEADEINGVKIAKGEIVALFTYGLHRSAEYWDNPEGFIPERFTRENMKKISPSQYLPFGKGPRLCIGQQFAQIEMNLVLYHFIKNFKFTLKADYEMELDAKITLRPKHGMPMQFEQR